MPEKPIFFVVDDDDDDRDLLTLAWKEGNYPCELVFAEDGQNALEVLEQLEVKPSVMILDINMPRMDGLTLLERLKTSGKWREMPVLMLTTTDHAHTVQKAYSLGANSYIVKPNTYRDLYHLWDTVYQFWINTAQLPVRLG
jgi:CheY-like chemotaxis protein